MPVALSEIDASLVKGMLERGDKQQDIAAWFDCNSARVAEVKKGDKHAEVAAAPMHTLPPPGPYSYLRGQTGGAPSLLDQLQQVLATFDLKWSRELAIAAQERRDSNAKLDLLLRKVAALERERGVVEPPKAPRATRRAPIEA